MIGLLPLAIAGVGFYVWATRKANVVPTENVNRVGMQRVVPETAASPATTPTAYDPPGVVATSMARQNVVAFNVAKKALKKHYDAEVARASAATGVKFFPPSITNPPGVIGYMAAVPVAPNVYDVHLRAATHGPKLDAPLYRDGQLIASQGMADPALTRHFAVVIRVTNGVAGPIHPEPIGGNTSAYSGIYGTFMQPMGGWGKR
jgi:hypothetical protein